MAIPIPFLINAQNIYEIKADSVRIYNNSYTAELNLENGSKDTLGFLYNKGNGRTEFRRGLVKINDTSFVIGKDTLKLPGEVSPGVNDVFYVYKKYTGASQAVVQSSLTTSPVSTNSGYNRQLFLARSGSVTYAYPCPWSARTAALKAIQAGTITKAQIIILDNESWTVGSPLAAKNGSLTGVANSNVIADIQIDSANATTNASLLQNKIDYYFGYNSGITYINSAYAIYMSYQVDPLDNTFAGNITGHGFFRQIFGEVNGWAAKFFNLDNGKAFVNFKADEISLQQYRNFQLFNYEQLSITVLNSYLADANFLDFNSTRVSTKPCEATIILKNVRFGKGILSIPDSNDYWYFTVFNSISGRKSLINLSIDNLYMKSTEVGSLSYSNNVKNNLTLNFNIKNLVQEDSQLAYDPNSGLIQWERWDYPVNTTSQNCNVRFNIDNAVTESCLIGPLYFVSKTDTTLDTKIFVDINVGTHIRTKLGPSTGVGGNISLNISLNADAYKVKTGPKIKIRGRFINYNDIVVNTINNLNNDRVQFSGEYITYGSNKAVFSLQHNIEKGISLVDCILNNDGSTSSIITNNTPKTVFIKNVTASASPASNVGIVGQQVLVVPLLKDYQ